MVLLPGLFQCFFGIQVIPYYFLIYIHWLIFIFSLCFSLHSVGNQWNPGRWDGTWEDSPEYCPVGPPSRGERALGQWVSLPKSFVEYPIVFAVVSYKGKYLTPKFFVHLHPLKESLVSGSLQVLEYFIEWVIWLISLLWIADLPAL